MCGGRAAGRALPSPSCQCCCPRSSPPASRCGLGVARAGAGRARRRSLGERVPAPPAAASSALPAWSRPRLRRKCPAGRRRTPGTPPAMDASLEKVCGAGGGGRGRGRWGTCGRRGPEGPAGPGGRVADGAEGRGPGPGSAAGRGSVRPFPGPSAVAVWRLRRGCRPASAGGGCAARPGSACLTEP